MATVALLLQSTENVAAVQMKISQRALADAIVADEGVMPADESLVQIKQDDEDGDEPQEDEDVQIPNKDAHTDQKKSSEKVTDWVQPKPEHEPKQALAT